jgi:hypothetical protein
MRFRVAGIQDEGLPQGLTEARLKLEDWLNGALDGADFGCPTACVMIVVLATSALEARPAVSRLSKDELGNPVLALYVSVDPALVERVRPGGHLAVLCSHVVRGLPTKPLRKPRGLNYERLRKALLTCIEPLSEGAA